MIYEHDCYNLNVKYFDNLIEINIKNIPNKFIRYHVSLPRVSHDITAGIMCYYRGYHMTLPQVSHDITAGIT